MIDSWRFYREQYIEGDGFMANALTDFTKKREFLVCMDSDGCVMDTVRIKHSTVMCPELIRVFALDDHADFITAAWDEINLHTITRGVSRFESVRLVFDRLKNRGIEIPGSEDIAAWVDTATELSTASLQRELQKTGSLALRKLQEWNNACNRRIQALEPTFEPFPGVEESLRQLHAVADVAVGEADLTQAQMTLGYTSVQSPISGYISERNADIGTLVGPSGKSLLATVVKSDTVRVDFSMTALDYLRSKARNVNLGHRDSTRKWDPYITVTLADGSEYPYRGLVDFADPQVDPQTGTFSVRAEMANPDHILLPGQFTKVRLLLDVREDAVVVPSKAIEIEKGGAYIYVVRPDSIVEKRFVETGSEWGNNIVVERGLVRGEDIVVEGYHKLQHGMKVEPVAPRRDEEAEKQQ